MWKSYGYRKLAVLLAFVFVAGLALMACSSKSSGSSSPTGSGISTTGAPLQAPSNGVQELASLVMTMNPGAGTIETQVQTALSNTQRTVAEGFGVTTSNVVWDAVDTLTGDIQVAWSGADKLEEVSIQVIGADAVGANANINTDDVCGGATIGASVPVCKPGVTYVADVAADGPESEVEVWRLTPANRAPRYLRVLCPTCGQRSAVWSMTEASGATYTFYAKIFGRSEGYLTHDDTRYDPNTAQVTIQTYEPDWTTGNNPAIDYTQPKNSWPAGRWFYVSVWYDYPGASRAGTGFCADGNGNTTCSITPGVWEDYDFYFVEDNDNLSAVPPPPTFSTYTSTNTGFMFMGYGAWRMQFDPAIVVCNDDTDATRGSGGLNFRLYGGTGTRMRSYEDEDVLDQIAADVATSDMWRNIIYYSGVGTYSYALTIGPPLPDGVDVYGDSRTPGNFVQGDMNIGKAALKTVGPSGSGSRLSMSPSGNTVLFAGLGLKSATEAGAEIKVVQKSANYPVWADATGYAEGPGGSIGHYNEQIGYVCVQ